jgi:glycosyltransferase involved in cell wall biosynthesis
MMKVSIITVCYNSAETIADTLRSVRQQIYPDIEYIIVDGGSTDNTLKLIAAEGQHVDKLVSGRDQGIYDAMNKGLALATGEIVGFLNSDDVLAHASVVSRVVGVLTDPAVDACYGDLVYVAPNDLDKVVRYWRSRDYRPGLFQRGWVPAHPTFYARRALYRKYGGFDPELRLAADFDILLRFFEVHGITSVYIPEVLVKMRLGGATNVSFGNVLRQNMEIARAFRKYRLRAGLKPFFFKLMSRLSQFIRKPSACE